MPLRCRTDQALALSGNRSSCTKADLWSHISAWSCCDSRMSSGSTSPRRRSTTTRQPHVIAVPRSQPCRDIPVLYFNTRNYTPFLNIQCCVTQSLALPPLPLSLLAQLVSRGCALQGIGFHPHQLYFKMVRAIPAPGIDCKNIIGLRWECIAFLYPAQSMTVYRKAQPQPGSSVPSFLDEAFAAY